MTLQRVLETEVMDTLQQAQDYDEMDHGQVNQLFVADLLRNDSWQGEERVDVLDLGTGTAQIPIELCRQHANCRVMAVDLAVNMLDLARYNIEAEGLIEQITLQHCDAKALPFDDALFDVVMSNSIVHHIPQPLGALREAVRVTALGGLLFFRDLTRPETDEQVDHLVQTYAGGENEHQQKMFDDSFRAALTLTEMRELVSQLGFTAETVQATSDRHWTWIASKA